MWLIFGWQQEKWLLFKNQHKVKEKLSEIQEQVEKPPQKLPQEVVAGWNSTYFMLQRLHEQREPTGAALAPLTAPPELSQEKKAYASEVITIIRMIQNKITEKSTFITHPCTQLLSQNLLPFLTARWSLEDVEMLAKATVLNPRWRTLAFGNQTNAGEAAARAKCEDLKMHITSSTFHFNLSLYRLYKQNMFFPFFTVHNRGGPWGNNGRVCVWRPVGTSGLPIRLVALVWTKKKNNSDQTLYFTVLISCRCYPTVDSMMAEAAVEVRCNLSELYVSRGEAPLKLWQHMAAVLIPAHANYLCAVWKDLLKSWRGSEREEEQAEAQQHWNDFICKLK